MHLVIFVQWRKVVIFTNSLTASPPSEGWPVWSVCTFVVVRSLSHVWLFATPWTTARQASLSFTIFWSLLTLTSIESVMPSHHLILCYPLFPLPSIFSSIRVFANEEVYTEVSPFLSCARGRRCSSAMTPFSQAGSLSYCVGSCFWSAGPSELACGTNPLCHFQCSRKRHSIPEV